MYNSQYGYPPNAGILPANMPAYGYSGVPTQQYGYSNIGLGSGPVPSTYAQPYPVTTVGASDRKTRRMQRKQAKAQRKQARSGRGSRSNSAERLGAPGYGRSSYGAPYGQSVYGSQYGRQGLSQAPLVGQFVPIGQPIPVGPISQVIPYQGLRQSQFPQQYGQQSYYPQQGFGQSYFGQSQFQQQQQPITTTTTTHVDEEIILEPSQVQGYLSNGIRSSYGPQQVYGQSQAFGQGQGYGYGQGLGYGQSQGYGLSPYQSQYGLGNQTDFRRSSTLF